MDAVPAMVTQFDFQYNILMANKQFEALVGQDSSNIALAFGKGLKSKVQTFIDIGESHTQFEIQNRFREQERWYQVLLNTGKENELTMICYDIEAQKQNEVVLESQKETAVNSARLASLGEMAGGIAHEINNPLTKIVGQSNILKRSIEKKNFDQVKMLKSLTKIDEIVVRITKTIQGMKNLSRSSAVQTDEIYYLKDIIADVSSLSSQKFRIGQVQFYIDDVNEDWQVKCSYQEVGQVLVNLLNNAFDVVENLNDKEVFMRFREEDEHYYIDTVDSGPGVDDITKLSQPFFTTKPIGKGTGLGLSISRKIAQRNGGDLTYFREENKTIFRLSLPKVSALKKSA